MLRGIAGWFRQGRAGRKALLILLALLFLLPYIFSRQILSTTRFFWMMGEASGALEAGGQEVYLEAMKDVARFLLGLSEKERSRLVRLYNSYAWHSSDCNLPGGYNLMVLNRLLYDVPQDYPRNPPGFGFVWMGSTGHMLWPLEYDVEGRLIHDTMGILGGFGLCHSGIAEYYFFAEHFELRVPADLE